VRTKFDIYNCITKQHKTEPNGMAQHFNWFTIRIDTLGISN